MVSVDGRLLWRREKALNGHVRSVAISRHGLCRRVEEQARNEHGQNQPQQCHEAFAAYHQLGSNLGVDC